MVVDEFLEYLKENSEEILLSSKLKIIRTYSNHQAYYIEEFPENTPLIACYKTRKIPKLVETENYYKLDFYLYFEKQELDKMSEYIEKYESIIENLLLDWCEKPEITTVDFYTYYAEKTYFLYSFSIAFKLWN